MKQVRTKDASGNEWVVRRRWLPWKLRWRGPGRPGRGLDGFDGIDLLGGVGDGTFGSIIGLLLMILVAVILVFFILPIVVFLLELLLTILIVTLVVSIRIALGKAWLVDAFQNSSEKPQYVWAVRGWRASGQAVDQVAAQLQAGIYPPVLPTGQMIAT